MPIEIAGIQLNRIHKVSTVEQAAFVYHRVPGLEGSVAQNLGRDSVRLHIEGIFYGSTAKEDLETLREAHKKREPVDFLADIVGQAYFAQVTLERFQILQSARDPEQFSFALTIAEYVVPPEPKALSGLFDVDLESVNLDILEQAQSFMDIAMLPDLLGSIPEVTNPLEPLNSALSEVEQATSNLETVTAGLKTIFGV
jgi:hypothetical protein